ncbi:Trm112p-domain-containing protein [Coniophora puteana RWD-64-598 SS2]|uniref:Trm112p-domain-containing protein n=1 Tax=Coniophora puteana (strain RWD-64-598) TaxID=741705 RepID=A0A5M3MFV9_CONPW|nr:Trm112p-domain-containing protein [Coniophora puteana RWD-64-598 SS2]EIW77654.1 Trm112p-domain-containing protein [Coniophora puteana RWD-64-598 SS2]
MHLITHNLLARNAKGCTTNSFPLAFRDAHGQVEIQEQDINPDFVCNVLPRLEWKALIDAACQVGDESLPAEQPNMTDDELVQKLHYVLMEIHITEGAMVCSNCEHICPISNSIPNSKPDPKDSMEYFSTLPVAHLADMTDGNGHVMYGANSVAKKRARVD